MINQLQNCSIKQTNNFQIKIKNYIEQTQILHNILQNCLMSNYHKDRPPGSPYPQLRTFFILIFIIQTYLLTIAESLVFNASMQDTQQTFLTYIPFYQSCSYQNYTQISPGTISYQNITSKYMFQYYQKAQMVAFWSSIQNGLDIYMRQQTLLNGYDGIVYKPTTLNQNQQHISKNNTNDIVSLFKVMPDGSLNISYVQVYLQKQQNYTLSPQLIQSQFPNISSTLKTLLLNCSKNNSDVLISQLDLQYFIGTCINTPYIFIFSLNQSYVDQVLDLSTLTNLSMPINGMILNPILQIDGIDEIGRNIFLLTNGSQQTYSCQFNPLNSSNIICNDSSQLQKQFQLLLQILWNEQSKFEQIKLEKLLSHISPQTTQKFPGQIYSIFIDQKDYIYVQSINTTNITFLNIFDYKKTHILNISFSGKILLFNSLEYLIQNNDKTYFIMKVSLPLLSIHFDNITNDVYALNLTCSNNVPDLQIVFNFFISNIQYPTTYVHQIQQPNLSSNISIYTFQLQKYFTVYGPGYTVYYKGPQALQATLLDASILSINTYVLSIVQLMIAQSASSFIFQSSNVIYTTQDSVHLYSGSTSSSTKILSNPCGINYNLKGIKTTPNQKVFYGYKQKHANQLSYCLCNADFYSIQNCKSIQKDNLKSVIMNKNQKESLKLQKMNNLGLLQADDYSSTDCGSCINDRLYTIVDKELLVTTFNNNTAVLSNFYTQQYYDHVSLSCVQNGQLLAAIYQKQFFDITLYLFCQLSQFIYQYVIRQNQFIFNRVVPLYGFTTRSPSSNQTSTIYVGNNYIYVEVQVDQDTNSSININPFNIYCCVLRIDPYADTVSSIKQVIFARNVQQVYQFSGIDVATYQGSQVTDEDSFLKIYLDATWLAISQTKAVAPVQNYDFSIIFTSINYNMAAQYPVSITYNLTSTSLIQKQMPFPSQLQLQQIQYSAPPEIFTTNFQFSYNGIYGPIMKSTISSSPQLEIIQDIQLNYLIVQKKLLGNVGDQYTRIFTPMQGRSNTTFDNTIIVVGPYQLQVYINYFNNQQMFFVDSVSLTQFSNCDYFPFKVINFTTIQFISQCTIPQNNLKIPILNLTLTLQIYNQSQAYLYSTLQLSSIDIKVQLENLKTLVFQNHTVFLGISQGPMQSLTGKLQFCSYNGTQICAALFISSKQAFLLYYDAFIYDYSSEQFIVVTLDFQFITVLVNLTSPSITSYKNYTINLQNYIKQDCSVITLIDATATSFKAILSGTIAYYEVFYEFGGDLQIITTFQRYGNCELFDKFPVSVQMDQNRNILALVAQCNQNQDTIRLQSYQRMNSSDVVIYTGYLQFYTRSGPFSYLQTQQIPSYNPIRILPLSTMMISKLFTLYTNVQKQTINLVYQKIDGVIADNTLSLVPSLSITLSPLTTNIDFPTLQFTIKNTDYQLNFQILTSLEPQTQLTDVQIVFLIIFVVCNGFNIIVMVFYFIYNSQKGSKQPVQRQSVVVKQWTDQAHSPTGLREFKTKFKDRISGFSILSRKQTLQRKDKAQKRSNQQRKLTEIQLFTRRSERSLMQNDRTKNQSR